MTSTRITLHGGIGTVGGVVAEIVHGTDRVICEIGTGYTPTSTSTTASSNVATRRG